MIGIGRTAGRPATGRPDADAERVVEILCADPELLRSEFDAITAANFPAGLGLPVPRGRRIVGVRAALVPRHSPGGAGERTRGAPGGDQPPPAARERSPPRR